MVKARKREIIEFLDWIIPHLATIDEMKIVAHGDVKT